MEHEPADFVPNTSCKSNQSKRLLNIPTPAKKGYSTFRLKSQDILNAPKCAYISSVGTSELARTGDLANRQRLGRPDPPT
eukprot:6044032-Pleurochrysis_carterae.AAC.1